MTYAQGGLIQATDYNGFVQTGSPNFNAIWNGKYGQTALPTVSVGALVGHTEWNNLFQGINNVALSQGTLITPLPTVAAGDIITYESALVGDLAAITAGENNSGGFGTDITSTGTRTTNWGTFISIPTVTSTITVTFASAQNAQNFFNRGGVILLSTSRTGGVGTVVDTTWSTLCTNVGSLGVPAYNTAQTLGGVSYLGLTQFSGGGSPPTDYVRSGYYQMTSTPALWFRQFTNSSVYTSDRIELRYSTTGAVVTITMSFYDSTTSAFAVTGNLSVTGIVRPPSSTYISNNWGTPGITVSAPA